MSKFNGTPHNEAKLGEIAKTVLMPGDPLRAKFIAENFLENAVQFNSVRGMLGYTGTYKGVPVSVMGSGMGMPSIGIYSYELYKFYGVENIIRIGSAGAYTDTLDLFDLVIADAAWSQSSYAKVQCGNDDEYQYPSKHLNCLLKQTAERLGHKVVSGCILSVDVFYTAQPVNPYKEKGTLCVEMESFALFANAKHLGKNAACILTVSDSLVTHRETTAEQRQTAFTDMMQIALETAIKL